MTTEADQRLQLEASDAVLRIAKILDMPPSAFDAPSGGRHYEAIELLTLFSCIKCPEARSRCLSFLRAEIERGDRSA